MKNKKTILLLIVCLAVFVYATAALAQTFQYNPVEKIPGFESETTGNFYTYIQAVYKFGIWAVGIAAMFMIIWGGYLYITSAGNNASMEKAKGVIFDAVIGLVLALTAYLILYIINPDLVKIRPLSLVGTPGVVTPPPPPPPGQLACSAAKVSSATASALSCIKAKPNLTLGKETTFQGQHVCNLSANPAKISCHYGGRDCNGEANAIDFGGPPGPGGGEAYQNIVNAANSCGVHIARCEDSSGIKRDCSNMTVDHVHITVSANCGCS